MKLLVIAPETFLALRRYLIDTGGKGTQHVVALDEAAQDGMYFLKKLEESQARVAQTGQGLMELRESLRGL